MKLIITLIVLAMARISSAQPAWQLPITSASAVVQFTVTNAVMTNWNVPNAFAGKGAKMRVITQESVDQKQHGVLNFIASKITRSGTTWTIEMQRTNIYGKPILFTDDKLKASEILKEPFGFGIYNYFLAYGFEVTKGNIALEINGVTNNYPILPHTVPGNLVFTTVSGKTNFSHRPLWIEHKRKR